MGLMEAVLRSLEGVLCRMNGEVWQQQDSTAINSHRDIRESELPTRYIQVNHLNQLKQHRANLCAMNVKMYECKKKKKTVMILVILKGWMPQK